MNWDIVQAQWSQLKGPVRSRWAKLTDEELAYVGGNKDRLVETIQDLYAISAGEAEEEIEDFLDAQEELRARNPAQPRVGSDDPDRTPTQPSVPRYH